MEYFQVTVAIKSTTGKGKMKVWMPMRISNLQKKLLEGWGMIWMRSGSLVIPIITYHLLLKPKKKVSSFE
jgi:hypothetical protein